MDQRIRKKENQTRSSRPCGNLGKPAKSKPHQGFNFRRPVEPGFEPQAIGAISSVSGAWGKERGWALFSTRLFSSLLPRRFPQVVGSRFWDWFLGLATKKPGFRPGEAVCAVLRGFRSPSLERPWLCRHRGLCGTSSRCARSPLSGPSSRCPSRHRPTWPLQGLRRDV